MSHPGLANDGGPRCATDGCQNGAQGYYSPITGWNPYCVRCWQNRPAESDGAGAAASPGRTGRPHGRIRLSVGTTAGCAMTTALTGEQRLTRWLAGRLRNGQVWLRSEADYLMDNMDAPAPRVQAFGLAMARWCELEDLLRLDGYSACIHDGTCPADAVILCAACERKE